MPKPKVIAIVGPTSSGKSSLGVYLAKKLGGLSRAKSRGEIISADSRQVYKGLDIGTGKVTKKEMQGIPHHLLSVVSPKRQFSVDDFVKKAERIINTSIYRSILPIVVGGTGFYVDTLLGRMSYPNVAPNPRLRARLEKLSVEALYKMLKAKDSARANTIEPKHKRRIIRALEIAEGRRQTSRSECKTWASAPERTSERSLPPYQVLWLGLNPAPAQLKKNIHTRLNARLTQGMIAEAKRLHKNGLSYKRMEELGLEYRYLARLLQNKLTKQEFFDQLEREINKYTKRQMRWFKRNKDIHWVNNKIEALRLAKAFLSR